MIRCIGVNLRKALWAVLLCVVFAGSATIGFGAEMNWAFLRDGVAPGDAPPPRQHATCWRTSDGCAYVFGLRGNDLRKYDPAIDEWSMVRPGQEASYGTQGVSAPSNSPGVRSDAVSWTGADGLLYLFGGLGYTVSARGFLNDLWCYDVATNTWTWLKGSALAGQYGVYGTQGMGAPGNTPAARNRAVSWTGADGSLYLFGGKSSFGDLSDLWRYDVPTNTWTWVKGSSSIYQPGIYGTQGVGAEENMPGGRSGAVSWTGTDGALYLFGGCEFFATIYNARLNDLWRYDVPTNTWTWLKGGSLADEAGVYGTLGAPAAANTPGARECAAAWMGSDGLLYLFGGDGRNASSRGYLSDLWCYDVVANRWTWMNGSSSINQCGIYGTQGVGSTGNTPGGRDSATAWTGADGALYLLGGYGGDASSVYGHQNDLWRYDAVTNTWTWLNGSSSSLLGGVYGTRGVGGADNTPGARSDAVSWTGADGLLYVFGGHYGLNDLWRYDVLANSWTWLKGSSLENQSGVYGTRGEGVPENSPGARSGAVSWTGTDGSLYLFGGSGYAVSRSNGPLNDLWRYDVPTNTWTWLKGSSSTQQPGVYGTQGEGAPENTPGARSGAVSWTGTDGSLYLFGGSGCAVSRSDGPLNDLWRYDLPTNTWTWLKGASSLNQEGVCGTQGVGGLANTPGARTGAISWTGTDGGLYLFGGAGNAYGSWYSENLNDLWRYDPLTNNWTWLKGVALPTLDGIHGTQGVGAPDNTPGGRREAVSWTGADGSLYLFGGFSGFSSARGGSVWNYWNDLWRYDVGSNTWTWVKGSSLANQPGVYGRQGVGGSQNAPEARSGAVLWTGADGELYLFGGDWKGIWLGDHLNDLWRLSWIYQADLAISVSTDSLVPVGGDIHYSISVRNNGPDTAHGVTVSAGLPSQLQYVDATATRGTATRDSNGNLSAVIDSLAVDETARIDVTLRGASVGTFSSDASVSCTEEDLDMSNDAATASFAVRALSANVGVVVSASPDPLTLGQNLTCRIVVNNTGPDAAANTSVTLALPNGAQFVSVSSSQGSATLVNGVVVAELGSVAVESTASVTVIVLPTLPGAQIAQVTVASDIDDPDMSDNAVSVGTQVVLGSGPDLSGSWSAVSARPRSNPQGTTWHIMGTCTVENAGNANAGRNTVQVYVSDTPSVPRGATPSARFTMSPLRQNKTSKRVAIVGLPSAAVPSGKYLIAAIDATNAVAEANEFNNVCVFGPLP